MGLYLILSPALLLFALIFKMYTPQHINLWYGYRTKRSMSSQRAWRMANEFSSTLLLLLAIVLNIVQASCFLFLNRQTAFLVVGILITVSIMLIIPLTEIHLRKNLVD